MAWDEWGHLKAAAAEQHTAHMQLNELQTDGREDGTPNSGSSGAGTLKHSGGPWTKAAKTADDLEFSTTRAAVHDPTAEAAEGRTPWPTLAGRGAAVLLAAEATVAVASRRRRIT
jgi:hypothetical protein